MAHPEPIRTDEIIAQLKKTTGSADSNRLSDQNVDEFGSNRIDEIRAQIGDNGQSFRKLYVDHINSL